MAKNWRTRETSQMNRRLLSHVVALSLAMAWGGLIADEAQILLARMIAGYRHKPMP